MLFSWKIFSSVNISAFVHALEKIFLAFHNRSIFFHFLSDFSEISFARFALSISPSSFNFFSSTSFLLNKSSNFDLSLALYSSGIFFTISSFIKDSAVIFNDCLGVHTIFLISKTLLLAKLLWFSYICSPINIYFNKIIT